MTVTIDPASLAEFFFVYPIQWWYYAVGVGVVAAVRFIQSSLKKKVVPDASRSSPLKTAQEYGADEAESRPEGENVERNATLEGLVRKPKIQVQGDGSAIDQATEYMIASAMINSAKYVRFRNIKIPTKFGELVFDNKEAEKPTQVAPTEAVPPVPAEDQTEGNQ